MPSQFEECGAAITTTIRGMSGTAHHAPAAQAEQAAAYGARNNALGGMRGALVGNAGPGLDHTAGSPPL